MFHEEVNINREFVVHGLSWVFSGLLGGHVHELSSADTLCHRKCGGNTRWSCALSGVLLLIVFMVSEVLIIVQVRLSALASSIPCT